MDTGSRKWGSPYLNREFFSRLGQGLGQQTLLVMAKKDGRTIAGALNLFGEGVLFGRNWGAIDYVPASHNSDGTIDSSKPTANLIIGNPNPKWTGSFSTNVSYKKLNLHILLDAVQGVDVFNADFRTRQGVDNGKIAEMEDNGQLPRGFIAGNYNIQEWRVDDGSFVKLRELALSYSFGKLKGISDLSVSLGGRNLISWDNYKGYDPELNAAGQSTVLRGIDFGSVPVPRSYNLSVRAKF